MPKIPLIAMALVVGLIGAYFLIASRAATSCTTTLNPGASIQNALSSASPGAVICLNSGSWSTQTFSGIAPSSTVTLQPAPNATVHIDGINLNGPGNTKNLTVQGFYIDGPVQGLCGIDGGVIFQYNTIQHINADNAFYYYANGCGGSHVQTGVSMLNNQIDHVGECLTVAGGASIEKNFTFKDNVCGPDIGAGVTRGNQYSHYIEIGCMAGGTFDNNAFLGPYDATALSNTDTATAVHNNVFHCFGDGSDISFSNNIVYYPQSRAQTVLIQSGKMDDITIHNNLFVNDPACRNTSNNCPAQDIEVYATHGLNVTNNTIVATAWGLHFPSVCNDGCYASGTDNTLTNNIVEAAAVTGNSDYAEWGACVTNCVTGSNVSYDTSAVGSPSVKNWAPSYANTTWTPHDGEPYSPPPSNYYVATGLPFTAGWNGTGGPHNGVGAAAFNGGTTTPPADTTAPTVSITAPAGGATVSGSTTVTATASDNTGVSGVQFKLDGVNLGSEDTSTSYSATWNTATATNGTHTLTAVARDAAGNTKTSSTVTVTVNNVAAGSCATTVSSVAAAQSAVASATAGQTVCLANGSYGKITLSTDKSAPGVTLKAQNAGQATVDGFDISGSYVTVSQLNITDEVTIAAGTNNVTVSHNHITGGDMGVNGCVSSSTYCNDLKIIGNKFEGPYGQDAIRLNRYHDADGDGIGALIEGNEITNVRENGNHSDCLQAVWQGDHLTYRNNYVHDNRCQGFFVKDQDTPITGITVYDNLFLRNTLACDAAAPGCGQPSTIQIFGPYTGLTLSHNTAWGDGSDSLLTLQNGVGSGTSFSNNAIYRMWTSTDASGATFQNNLYCSLEAATGGAWPSSKPGSVTNCSPTFTNTATDDYRITGSNSDKGIDWRPADATYGPNGSVTTPPPSDTTAPTVSFASPANGATVSGTVTATAAASDDTAVTKVEISLDGTLKMTDTSAPYNYSFDSKTLSNGSHTLSAKAYDAAGNTKTSSITITVNNADTTAPNAPANLNATATTSTTVNLTWTASTDTGANQTGIDHYNVLRNGVVIAQPATTSYTDTGRAANTTYTYVVQAVDGADNVSANSNTDTATTPTTVDTTAPTVPGSLQATAPSVHQVNLSWTASTDSGGSGLAGYNVYRNGTKLNSSLLTTTSYGDSTVTDNTTYSYKVEAVDGAGNKSAQTSAVSVKTPQVVRGDITGANGTPDGKIDLYDISYVIRNYNTTNANGDISGPSGVPDGKVDLYDISYVIRNYGQ